jgi:hypothetical protein
VPEASEVEVDELVREGDQLAHLRDDAS